MSTLKKFSEIYVNHWKIISLRKIFICKLLKESASRIQRRNRLKMLTDGRRPTAASIYFKLTHELSAEVSYCLVSMDYDVWPILEFFLINVLLLSKDIIFISLSLSLTRTEYYFGIKVRKSVIILTPLIGSIPVFYRSHR